MKKYLLLVIMFFIFTKSSFADSKCSYTEQAELLNKAANVKTSYEIATEKVSFIDGDATVDGTSSVYTFLSPVPEDDLHNLSK